MLGSLQINTRAVMECMLGVHALLKILLTNNAAAHVWQEVADKQRAELAAAAERAQGPPQGLPAPVLAMLEGAEQALRGAQVPHACHMQTMLYGQPGQSVCARMQPVSRIRAQPRAEAPRALLQVLDTELLFAIHKVTLHKVTLHMPSTGAQAVNAQLRAEVAALRVTVAAHGSTSECSSQTDAPHGGTKSGAAATAKSERIAELAYAPRCAAMSSFL